MRARDACAWALCLMSVPERLRVLAQSAFWKIAGPLYIVWYALLVFLWRPIVERPKEGNHGRSPGGLEESTLRVRGIARATPLNSIKKPQKRRHFLFGVKKSVRSKFILQSLHFRSDSGWIFVAFFVWVSFIDNCWCMWVRLWIFQWLLIPLCFVPEFFAFCWCIFFCREEFFTKSRPSTSLYRWMQNCIIPLCWATLAPPP